MKRNFTIGFIACILMLLFSCSPEANNNKEFIINTTLVASGPLFEGSNTCQSEISANLTDYLNEHQIKKDEIVDITLISASITNDSSENMNLIESINLQVFSDNFPMQNIAVANPIKENIKVVDLKVAELQEQLQSILLEDQSYVVADATIKEDLDDDLNLQTELKFSINYYRK